MEQKSITENEKRIVGSILTEELSTYTVKQIVDVLKIKGYIEAAVFPETPESELFGDFLQRFWNYDKSPYVKEKLIVGQSIHRRYVKIMQQRSIAYWIPLLGNRTLGTITREDIKKAMWKFASTKQPVKTRKKDAEGNFIVIYKNIAAETVNQIVRAATTALKWAYYNKLTQNDCFSGIVYCHVVPEKRRILTLEEVQKVFSFKWENESYKLANLTSMFTGMRIGEVQALQIRDIGKDRIYVRHNWARMDGLKKPKNGDEREIKIPDFLRKMLLDQAYKNPFGTAGNDFVFYGYARSVPCGCRHWNEALHDVLFKIGITDYKKITFHCWRHFFTTNMADNIEERKLQFATGHKTLEILEHYASHESEAIINELGIVAEKIFLPLVNIA